MIIWCFQGLGIEDPSEQWMIMRRREVFRTNPEPFFLRPATRSVTIISKLFREAVRDAKLDMRLHFHSLRHSFCSNLASRGVSLFQIATLAGHANTKTTEGYSHLQPVTMHSIVDMLASN